jgi:NAD(P)H dehydrogenase (quinone)
MKHLVIVGYQPDKNLNRFVREDIASYIEKYTEEVTLRNLYEIGFNPIVSNDDVALEKMHKAADDVLIEQQYVREADVISFVYPISWGGMPAIIKGYIERVFTEGFAYSIEEGSVKRLLEGKEVVIINTLGRPNTIYFKGGIYDPLFNLYTGRDIFEFCGMEVILHYFMEDIGIDFDEEDLKAKVKELRLEIKKSLFLRNNSRLFIPNPF